MIKPTFSWLLKNPIALLGFGFGSGLPPKAPGTFGTLMGFPFFAAMYFLPLPWYFLVCVLLFIVGVYICEKTSQLLGVHDFGGIVWDEIVGLLITLAILPRTGWALVLGFIAFRAFDIIKPWPINWLDKRVHGGFGIMIDDVIAGIYAGALVYVLLSWTAA